VGDQPPDRWHCVSVKATVIQVRQIYSCILKGYGGLRGETAVILSFSRCCRVLRLRAIWYVSSALVTEAAASFQREADQSHLAPRWRMCGATLPLPHMSFTARLVDTNSKPVMSPNESVQVTAKGWVSRGNPSQQADERWLVFRVNRILLYQDSPYLHLGWTVTGHCCRV